VAESSQFTFNLTSFEELADIHFVLFMLRQLLKNELW